MVDAIKGKIILDSSDADNKIKGLDIKATKLDEGLEKTKQKLALIWSYGNQIATMLLNNISRAAEGAREQAKIQEILAGIQIAQQEVSIASTQLQAAAAFASGNILQGILLQSITIMMQTGLITAEMKRVETQRAQERAESLRTQMEAYRS